MKHNIIKIEETFRHPRLLVTVIIVVPEQLNGSKCKGNYIYDFY